jgi:spore germination protein YaaH
MMKPRHGLFLAMAILCACAAPAPKEIVQEAELIEPKETVEVDAGSLQQATTQEIWAYHAYWMGDAWRQYDLRAFGRMLFMDLPIGKNGRVQDTRGWPDQWSRLRAGARAANVQIDPAFTILTPEVFIAVFSKPEGRKRLLADILFLARFSRGVHLDFEVYDAVPPAVMENFNAFLVDLRRALDANPRKILTAFVPASSAIFGEPQLALLDAVIVQGYDLHWRESPNAGPPALLDDESPAAWRTAAQLLAQRGVPPAKLLFSTPFYGYEWPTVSGEPRAATRAIGNVITYAPVPASILPDIRVSALARIREHGLQRDMGSGTPWYKFRDRDGWRQGWFDDPISLAPRLDFVRRGGYRGVAVFVLGYDNGELLGSIRSAFRERSAPAGGGNPPGAR